MHIGTNSRGQPVIIAGDREFDSISKAAAYEARQARYAAQPPVVIPDALPPGTRVAVFDGKRAGGGGIPTNEWWPGTIERVTRNGNYQVRAEVGRYKFIIYAAPNELRSASTLPARAPRSRRKVAMAGPWDDYEGEWDT